MTHVCRLDEEDPGREGKRCIAIFETRGDVTAQVWTYPAGPPEESLVRFGPGSFLGELNMLTGQAVYLIARVVEDGRVHRIAPARFRS